ncbi:MAG: type I glyceraldehyde-3-phosphate dehydrogenase [Owenweeksia sp.]
MRIAINGFGRIGRITFRQLTNRKEVEVVAINDLTDPAILAHLLKYDSVHGKFPYSVESTDSALIVNGKEIRILSQKDPAQLPWKEMGVEMVLECTGIFRDREGMSKHITAGAKKVILSAPAKGDIKTVVLGVNDHELNADDDMVSNASCTTNCLAPMVKVLHEKYGIVKGYMTTTHAYTADQNLQDAPHDDLRRARAASLSIIPTTTGAAKAVGLVLPEMKGRLDGFAMRVPTPTGSVADLTVELEKEVSADEINRAMKEAGENALKGILEYTDEPIVSADIMGHPASCIFDSELTATNGNMAKVVGWYDNEMGYSSRLADLTVKMSKL